MTRCFRCGRKPKDIPEYHDPDLGYTPEVAARGDGTYNPETDTFACTECYVAIGCPSLPGQGWRAPAYRGELK